MLADFCSLFLEHGPYAGQRQLLEDAFHLFWWVGHRSLDPPFEQGEKGPGQVLGDHWQRDRRRTSFCTQGGKSRFNRSTECRLQGFPQGLARTASHQRPKVLMWRLVDMLKQLQTWHDPLSCWCMGDLVREHRELLLYHTVENILFIEIMGIEGSTTNVCPIQNILHQNPIVGFFYQEFREGGAHQVIRALGTTIGFLLFHECHLLLG